MTNLFKILSDETRLRILILLYHQDLCVCEMVTILNESQPKISKHIAKIRTQGFVQTERNEQFIYYSLNRDNNALVSVLSTIISEVADNDPYQLDLDRLGRIEEFVCGR